MSRNIDKQFLYDLFCGLQGTPSEDKALRYLAHAIRLKDVPSRDTYTLGECHWCGATDDVFKGFCGECIKDMNDAPRSKGGAVLHHKHIQYRAFDSYWKEFKKRGKRYTNNGILRDWTTDNMQQHPEIAFSQMILKTSDSEYAWCKQSVPNRIQKWADNYGQTRTVPSHD